MKITRTAELLLTRLCRQFPCVVLLGPRQVGKTTLVKQLSRSLSRNVVYLDLERHSDLVKLDEAEMFFETHRDQSIIIDEVQLKPSLFTSLRPEIDAHRKPGRFILTGSASPHLVQGVSESLAGRVAYVNITPVSLDEALNHNIPMNRHWFRGGFPEALLARSHGAFHQWADYFIRSYVERDLSAMFGVGITPALARNFWMMAALQNGNIWNAEAMARSLGVSGPTVNRYLDFMEAAFLLRRLPAWAVNAKKRLVKSPKIYVRDSGLLHFLNNIPDPKKLVSHPAVGASWEGYVIEEICRKLPLQIQPYFYRTHHGAEIDLVLSSGPKALAAIEIKFSSAPSVKEGYLESVKELGTRHHFIIYPGNDEFFTRGKIKAVPLANFLTKYLPKIKY